MTRRSRPRTFPNDFPGQLAELSLFCVWKTTHAAGLFMEIKEFICYNNNKENCFRSREVRYEITFYRRGS